MADEGSGETEGQDGVGRGRTGSTIDDDTYLEQSVQLFVGVRR